MEYLKPSFTVAPGKSKAFRDGYDAIDWGNGKKPKKKPSKKKTASK